ncbi:MAG: Alkylpyrone O-methyltransferase (B. subtilis BpsB), partial [uncultured Rubrobacteraceae bacterium]
GPAAPAGAPALAAQRAPAAQPRRRGAGEAPLPGDGRRPRLVARLHARRGAPARAGAAGVVARAARAVPARPAVAVLGHLFPWRKLERAHTRGAGREARQERPVPPFFASQLRGRRRRSPHAAPDLRRLDDGPGVLDLQHRLLLRAHPRRKPGAPGARRL